MKKYNYNMDFKFMIHDEQDIGDIYDSIKMVLRNNKKSIISIDIDYNKHNYIAFKVTSESTSISVNFTYTEDEFENCYKFDNQYIAEKYKGSRSLMKEFIENIIQCVFLYIDTKEKVKCSCCKKQIAWRINNLHNSFPQYYSLVNIEEDGELLNNRYEVEVFYCEKCKQFFCESCHCFMFSQDSFICEDCELESLKFYYIKNKMYDELDRLETEILRNDMESDEFISYWCQECKLNDGFNCCECVRREDCLERANFAYAGYLTECAMAESMDMSLDEFYDYIYD